MKDWVTSLGGNAHLGKKKRENVKFDVKF